MRRCTTLLGLGLLLWAEPASAQSPKVYELTVSQQTGVQRPLTKSDVKSILKKASDILARCKVKFTLKGEIGTFKTAAAIIETEDQLEAAHNVPADVKVVEKIHYCVGKRDDVNGHPGCSWRPADRRPKTMIVSRLAGGIDVRPFVWAHEFGHTTGLQHRVGATQDALMTPCNINQSRTDVTDDECKCFFGGPGSCDVPQNASQKCPAGADGD